MVFEMSIQECRERIAASVKESKIEPRPPKLALAVDEPATPKLAMTGGRPTAAEPKMTEKPSATVKPTSTGKPTTVKPTVTGEKPATAKPAVTEKPTRTKPIYVGPISGFPQLFSNIDPDPTTPRSVKTTISLRKAERR